MKLHELKQIIREEITKTLKEQITENSPEIKELLAKYKVKDILSLAKKLQSEGTTIAKELGITKFPFLIKDQNGKQIYYESSTKYWKKFEYDQNGNKTYYENSNKYWEENEYDKKGNLIYKKSDKSWEKYEYDQNGNVIYYEDSDKFFFKKEYDKNGNLVYLENPKGIIKDNRPKSK